MCHCQLLMLLLQVFTNDIPVLCEGVSDIALDTVNALIEGLYFTYRMTREIGARACFVAAFSPSVCSFTFILSFSSPSFSSSWC